LLLSLHGRGDTRLGFLKTTVHHSYDVKTTGFQNVTERHYFFLSKDSATARRMDSNLWK